MPTFADLGVPDDLRDALDARDIAAPFPIQTVTIPPALARRDVCGRAPTGSGKTLAFGIPLVATVERARPKRPRGLVLVPTRELAAQVATDLTWLGARRDIRVHAFYGGVRFDGQVKALRRGVDIAVACPGRLADLVSQKIIRLDGVDMIVIDEADRMADMGFLPEVKRLLDQTDPARQVLLFSATLDGDVDELITRYQHDPVREDVTPTVPKVHLTHHFWSVKPADRVATTASIIQRVGPTIVFTRTRHGADRVARQLGTAGVRAVAIHGNRSQNQRERALADFTSGRAQAMVATDVAARGIHIDAVECVVHFDLPADHKDYVHRSGRTGRAGSTGVVVALVMGDKRKDAARLARTLDLDVTTVAPTIDVLPRYEAVSRPAREPSTKRNRQTERSRKGRPATKNTKRSVDRDDDDERPRRAGPDKSRRGEPRRSRSDNEGSDERPRRGPRDGHGPAATRPTGSKPKQETKGTARKGGPTNSAKSKNRPNGPSKAKRGPKNKAPGGKHTSPGRARPTSGKGTRNGPKRKANPSPRSNQSSRQRRS